MAGISKDRRVAATAFSAGQTCQITGVSYRTLDYWSRAGFLQASEHEGRGTGTRRGYSFRDLIAVRTARELRRHGVPLQSLRKILQFLRKDLMHTDISGVRLVLVNGDVALAEGEKRLTSLFKQPGQTYFAGVLDLGRLAGELQREVEKLSLVQDVKERRKAA